MLFQKIYIERTPESNGKPVEKWYLILRTYEDVLKYTEIDADLCTNALFALPASIERSHLEGSRERVLHTMMSLKQMSLKDNEKLSPINVLADLIDGKEKAMLKLIERGEKILVQQSGGYCTYDGYIKIWNGKVTEEIEKDTCYYPTDNEPIETDLLFIENGERVPVDFEREVDKMVADNWNNKKEWTSFNSINPYRPQTHEDIKKDAKVRYKLSHLKLRDPNFIAGMISKAKVIACETQLVDAVQIDNMMRLFSQLSGKTIIIKTEYTDDLKKHELFGTCNSKHTIKFI